MLFADLLSLHLVAFQCFLFLFIIIYQTVLSWSTGELPASQIVQKYLLKDHCHFRLEQTYSNYKSHNTVKFLITVIPTSAMILYQNAGVGKCLTNIWLHKEMNHIAVQSKCMGLAGYGLVHHHKSDGLESEVVKRLELILCKTHQNRICKDLGCWILYPCYSMFFTHTNSNWLQGTKHFNYHAAALISGT